jgi:hypothetical protein
LKLLTEIGGRFCLKVFIKGMIKLTKGNTETVYLTLTEKQSILDANFLCVFQSRSTNEKVKFVLVNSADQSNFPDRYNQFDIVVNTYFANREEGWYTYKIYEQASSSNLIEANAGAVVETGLMFLSDGEDVTTTKYNNPTTYKVYDAE